MAAGKNSFVLYSDLIGVVQKLLNKDKEKGTNNAGELFLHILKYVNDLNPEPENDIVDLAFEPIKLQMKRDLKKWENTSKIRSEIGREGGLKSAEARKSKKKQNEPIASNLKQNEHVTVTDNDNVNDNNVLLKKEPKYDFRKNLIDFGFEEKLVDEWLQVRKTKKATNTETAFKKFIEQVKISGQPINEILTICIEKSWSGFKNDWLQKEKSSEKKENNGKTPSKIDAISDSVQRMHNLADAIRAEESDGIDDEQRG